MYKNLVTQKQQLVENITPNTIQINLENSIWIFYFIGLFITLFLFAKELNTIYCLFKNGNKSTCKNWTLIETNANHSPFSFFNLLFIYQKLKYNTNEFYIIEKHEAQHFEQKHSLDLILISLLQIIFWFHPLIYIYKKLLVLVHEFQADAIVDIDKNDYGHFLVEQAIQGFHPTLAHSFSSSPLKTRLIMLTQKKSNIVKAIKYIAIVPVLLTSFVCISYAQKLLPKKKDLGNNKIEYNGNILTMSKLEKDTIEIEKQDGSIKVVIVNKDSQPIEVNGEKIYEHEKTDAKKPALLANYNTLDEYMFNKFKTDIATFTNGTYQINSSLYVINTNGKMIYEPTINIDRPNTYRVEEANKNPKSDKESKLEKISQAMANELFYNVKFRAGELNGKKVISYYTGGKSKTITVIDGKAKIE
jgi:hypothetical protein